MKTKLKIPKVIEGNKNLLDKFNAIYKGLPESDNYIADDQKNIGVLIEKLRENWDSMSHAMASAEKMAKIVEEKKKEVKENKSESVQNQFSFFKAIAHVQDSWEDEGSDFIKQYKIGDLLYGLWETRWAYVLSFLTNEGQNSWFRSISSKTDTFNDLTWRNRTCDEKAIDYFCNSKKEPAKRYGYVLDRLSEFKNTGVLSKNSLGEFIRFYASLEDTEGWRKIFDEDTPKILQFYDSKDEKPYDARFFPTFYRYVVLDGAIKQKDHAEWLAQVQSPEALQNLIVKYIKNKEKSIKEQIGRAAYNMATRMACQLNMSITKQKVFFILDLLEIAENDLTPYGSDSKRPGGTTRRSITLSELKYALYLVCHQKATHIKFFEKGKEVKLNDLLKNQEVKEYVESISSDKEVYQKMKIMKPKF